MGLGKTLTTLSLVSINKANKFLNKEDLIPIKGTLLVCPSQLCKQWQEKLKEFSIYESIINTNQDPSY